MTDVVNHLPGSALLDANKQLTFFCNFDAKLYQSTLDANGAWSPWVDLGGDIDFDAPVAVLSVPSNNPDSPILTVMTRGANGQVIYKTYEHGWGDWRDTQVEVGTTRGIAAIPTHALAMVWGVAPGGSLWQMRALNTAPGGVDLNLLPDVDQSPAAIRYKDNIDVFARQSGGSVSYSTRVMGHSGWSAWKSLGGTLTSGLAVASSGGSLRIFGRGADGQLWWNYQRSGGTWSADTWAAIRGQIASAPAVYVDAQGLDHVFARGKSGVLEYTARDGGGSWPELSPLVPGDLFVLDSAPLVVAYPDRAAVFARGLDGWIRWLLFTPRGPKTQWQKIPPPGR